MHVQPFHPRSPIVVWLDSRDYFPLRGFWAAMIGDNGSCPCDRRGSRRWMQRRARRPFRHVHPQLKSERLASGPLRNQRCQNRASPSRLCSSRAGGRSLTNPVCPHTPEEARAVSVRRYDRASDEATLHFVRSTIADVARVGRGKEQIQLRVDAAPGAAALKRHGSPRVSGSFRLLQQSRARRPGGERCHGEHDPRRSDGPVARLSGTCRQHAAACKAVASAVSKSGRRYWTMLIGR